MMSRLPFRAPQSLLLVVCRSLACRAVVAQAQRSPGALTLDPLVVTAARWPQPLVGARSPTSR